MDIYSHLLNGVRADGALFGQTITSSPWAIRIEDDAPLTLVASLRGDAWIRVDGGEPVMVPQGSSAVVAGRPFTITDSATSSVRPLYILKPHHQCESPDGEEIVDYALGTRTCGETLDAPSAVLTGTYQMRGRASDRLFRLLPPVIVIAGSAELVPLLDFTVAEIERDAPGQQAVLDRLLDLILLATLREWFAGPEAQSPRWYKAMSNPAIGRAMRLIHEEPERPWTVEALARECTVSRATFARLFSDIVGHSPMAYLGEWRLSLAADLLQSTESSLDTIAREVGYSNGFALSVAFKRVHGIRPSRYRAAQLGSSTPDLEVRSRQPAAAAIAT